MKTVLIVASLVLSVLAAGSIYDPVNEYDNCVVLNTEQAALMVLFWSIDGEYLNATIAGRTFGWVGFGVNVDNLPKMVHSDIVWGYVNEYTNETVVADFNNGKKMVCAEGVGVCDDTNLVDGVDNVVSYNIWQDDSVTATFLQFVRPLAAGDQYDGAITDSLQYFVYAMASFDSLGKHDIANGYVQLNLFSTASCETCPEGSTCTKGCCVPDPITTTGTTGTAGTTGTTGELTTGPATTGSDETTTSSASTLSAIVALIVCVFAVLF